MECAVCYCNNANCKLICGHSFCHQCVKDWYQKGSEQTCPMCRHRLYFKGMYKVTPVWEEERYYTQRDEAFAEAVEQIFEDSGSENIPELNSEFHINFDSSDEEDDSDDWETDSEGSESSDEYFIRRESNESESEDESTWSFEMRDRRLIDLADIQDQFNKFSDCGLDPSIFVQAYAEGAIFENERAYYEDFPTKTNIFISNYSKKPRGCSYIGNRLEPIGVCVN